MNLRHFVLSAAALALMVSFIFIPSCSRKRTSQEADTQRDTVYPYGFCTDSFEVVTGNVGNGEAMSLLLAHLGMSQAEAYKLTQATDSVFDARKLRAGNEWRAYYGTDSTGTRRLEYLVYVQGRTDEVVFHCSDPYAAWNFSRPVEIVRKVADVTINNSLWVDMTRAGVSPLLIVKLSDIYAWTVDFFTLQPGDRFRVLYNQRECEGQVIGVDSVFYAVFDHYGKEYPAILLDPGQGSSIYWNEKGESLRKAFLKAPLNFKRISSGFSYSRRHPITGRVQPHTGVDYAAPAGTPVVAVGDGTVTSAKNEGAGGNTVRITHNSVYKTAYLHLSKYGPGIKSGVRVRQGQVIGYVGSTGRSTGPHLDYRIWKNGSPVNPLTMESPTVEPLGKEHMPLLDSLRTFYSSQLDSLLLFPDS